MNTKCDERNYELVISYVGIMWEKSGDDKRVCCKRNVKKANVYTLYIA